ncbi:MAG: hypothetical protein KME32_14835 [Mojavia pulchra JT2-VF2]|jgi:hypothetical protein|uniref:Transmembrane protein n=1 Tax=Mojavia pulchra JT2-VF2 TaxID=287848 RepID=A0A951UGT3_9NOST|nr:hypothetical protein [Mojavia pulchra JT2-VF2]
MENSQSVQYKPTQPKRVTPRLTNTKPSAISNSQVLINLLARHPWLLLIGLSAIFVGSAVLALYSLGSAGSVQQPEEPETSPDLLTVLEEPIPTPSETSDPTPLWMIAAIALSCGSGCFIILRLLKHPAKGQKAQKQKRYQTSLVQGQQQRLEPQTLRNPPVFVPSPSLRPLVSMQANTKPLMTVLPPDHRHRLDKSRESLADLLDLRKQSSLPTLLRK